MVLPQGHIAVESGTILYHVTSRSEFKVHCQINKE